MSDARALQAATLLHRARHAGKARARLDRLPPEVHPETMAQGIAAQVALAGLQGAARPAGFKIGATARRMQEYLGLAGPAAGFMAAVRAARQRQHARLRRVPAPGVECELAVHLRRDLPPGPCTPEQAQDAVDRVMAAIELVENRYDDLAAFGAPAMVADQVFHAAAVLGEPYPAWRELDLLDIWRGGSRSMAWCATPGSGATCWAAPCRP